MEILDLVQLTGLMAATAGVPAVRVALIDGPVTAGLPGLAGGNIEALSGTASCSRAGSPACIHGTFVAGILAARRGSPAPALCPGCTLLVRPVFAEGGDGRTPSASLEELARAILDCLAAGARVVNLSVALGRAGEWGERALGEALDRAAARGVLVVAAAGNGGTLGGSLLTRHPWVLPVAACDRRGRPFGASNLGASIGRRGLAAPGEAVTSLGTDGRPLTLAGTSFAAPFVTGAAALLLSLFPAASAADLKLALTRPGVRRRSVVPPLLDARAAHQFLTGTHSPMRNVHGNDCYRRTGR